MLTDLVLRGAPIRDVAARAAQVEALGFDAVGVTETNGNPFLAAAQAAQATSRGPRGDGDRPRLSAHTDGHRLHGVGSAGAVRRTLRAGARLAGSRPRGASLRGRLVTSRSAHARVRARSARDLGRLGVRRRAGLPRRFYSHTLMPPNFRPPPTGHPRPPVLIAAVRERMTEVAGEVADGFLGHAFCTEAVLRELTLPALERGLGRAGRSRGDIEVTASVFVVTSDEEWEACRRRVAFYGSTPGYSHVLEHHRLGTLFEALHERSRSGGWAEMPALVDDDVLTLFAVRGTDPAAVAAEVRRRVGSVADRVGLVTEAADPSAIAPVAAAL